jgi:hypothetical protein
MPQSTGPTNAYFLPLHWVPQKLMFVWFQMPNVRRIMADQLGKAYSRWGGCAIVICFGQDNTGSMIAHVNASGAITECKPPYKMFPQHAMANKPVWNECPCQDLFYAEVCGPYRLSQKQDHHPLCEWEPRTMQLWRDPRVISVEHQMKRPDALEKIRDEYRAK